MDISGFYLPLPKIDIAPPFTAERLRSLKDEKVNCNKIRNFNSYLNTTVQIIWGAAGNGATNYCIDTSTMDDKNLPNGAYQLLITQLKLLFTGCKITDEVKYREVLYLRKKATVENREIVIDWTNNLT